MGYQNSKSDIIDNDKDMEEWDGDKYVGICIKKMKAYKCNLNPDALQKKRASFWKSKIINDINNGDKWSKIQRAITLDEPRDIHYLKHFKIEPINGCINECRDQDGNIYRTPNYCINDPYFERELKENDNNNIKNEELKISIYRYGNIKFELKVSNTLRGKDLKEECRQHENLKENLNIRIFICGVELNDDQYLYQHNISEDKPIYLITE